MSDIYHLFNIKTKDVSKIYEALTTQKGLASWWTVNVEGKPEIGEIIKFRFAIDYAKEMLVLQQKENQVVEWECISGDEQWVGTKIIFEIEDSNEGTHIRFKHKGWKKQTDLYAVCNYHWGLYLKSLKTLIETGKGNPNSY